MIPPEAPDTSLGNTPLAVSSCPAASLPVLSKRSEFLAAARAMRRGTNGMGVQARFRDDGDPTIRVGFTCSKKVGNAVARNRAKRRLREVARLVLLKHGKAGHDYVLIGRPKTTAERNFTDLQGDLIYALRKIHV